MEENNIIVISFPIGASGHKAGRLLASSEDVAWYNHFPNGTYPWEPYIENELYGVDDGFTPFHWNRRFAGAFGQGVCEHTVPPVLDYAERNGVESAPASDIAKWKRKLYPQHLMYAVHGDLAKSKKFFTPAKHLIIIPKDIDALLERVMQTTAKYYYSSGNKTVSFEDYYGSKTAIKDVLVKTVKNLQDNVESTDVVIQDVVELYDENRFRAVTEHLSIKYNKTPYNRVLNLFKSYT